uniref:Uncharacterized protein n=1 Tax=Compsopogon caeruleus TaxID=31354 RepID=A0A7S1T4Y9_9RHOD|mmetsp:Transcript_10368/g.20900  ORF Transcript_10368/g.20900 Transcript_10368/m.20900 type:complete len:437 (+) Transcript_10368:174-1484(+)
MRRMGVMRKRKRSESGLQGIGPLREIPVKSRRGSEVSHGRPFVSAWDSVGQGEGLSDRRVRGLEQPTFVNLVLLAGHRLLAHDFAGTAAIFPALLRRYRCGDAHGKKELSQEVFCLGLGMLRNKQNSRGVSDQYMTEKFLKAVVYGPESLYRTSHKIGALVELAMELVSRDRAQDAFVELRDNSAREPFLSSALVHGYLGTIALALAQNSDSRTFNRDTLLKLSSDALLRASSMDPSAHIFVFYASAAAQLAGSTDESLNILRTFCVLHPEDPEGFHNLLEALLAHPEVVNKDLIRQEKVSVARNLVRCDATSDLGLKVLLEAYSWKWAVSPRVDYIEASLIMARNLDFGNCFEKAATWSALSKLLEKHPDASEQVLSDGGRQRWWPSHYFRERHARSESLASPGLATNKARAAYFLFGSANVYSTEVAKWCGDFA